MEHCVVDFFESGIGRVCRLNVSNHRAATVDVDFRVDLDRNVGDWKGLAVRKRRHQVEDTAFISRRREQRVQLAWTVQITFES